MSVIAQLSIFPLDKGDSVSAYVARAVAVIRASGLPHSFGPMGTCIEGDYGQVMAVVERCYRDLEQDCDRIYVNVNLDCRKGADGRLEGKVRSVEKKL